MGKIVQLGWTRPIPFLEDLRMTQVQMRPEDPDHQIYRYVHSD